MSTLLHRASIAVAAVAAALIGHSAEAAVISTSSTFAFSALTGAGGTTRGNGIQAAGSFTDFNPALGTLTSVTLAISGQGTGTALQSTGGNISLNGGFIVGDNFTLTFPTQAIGTVGFNAFGAPLSVNASASDATGAVLAQFIGLGVVAITPVFTSDGGSSPIQLTFPQLTETLTYTYTPAIVTPPGGISEPAPLALLGVGIAGLVAARRTRRAR